MTRSDRLAPDLERPAAPETGEFGSILFAGGPAADAAASEPAFFADLNLDQVVDAIVAGRREYALEPFFYTGLGTVEEIAYRHAVFLDLERQDVRAPVRAFGLEMQKVRQRLTLAEKHRYATEKRRWFLDAVATYCGGVTALAGALRGRDLASAGLQAWRSYLDRYVASEHFASLTAGAHRVLDGLGRVRYTVRIRGARVTVGRYRGEPDYNVEIEDRFARFRQGAVESHLVNVPDSGTMDHVEARIAAIVARLFPEEFRALDVFCARHVDFIDAPVARFDREVQFYLAYLEHTEQLSAAGLPFCYPAVSASSKAVSADDAFDIALATRAGEPSSVVGNSFALRGVERVLVVTGPNQGGKTTFARMVGQLHHLASLGVPVPARRAELFLCDGVLTHFEREEDIATLRGKLDDELVRMRDILAVATADSVVILNEVFASTTLEDAAQLGAEILRRIVEIGALAVCVTFVDELASLGAETVSMVAAVAPEDPSVRTYKVVRQPADGRAYAWAIAAKYGLSYELLRQRISG
jgi:DNA mismatch repair protein MutS